MALVCLVYCKSFCNSPGDIYHGSVVLAAMVVHLSGPFILEQGLWFLPTGLWLYFSGG